MSPLPPIDYTNKDFASLRNAMLELARYRLPEWTDRSPSDLGVLLVDLFAYMGDVVLYYQDRIANESFLHTATERRSVLHLLRLIGYDLKPPVAASADLSLLFNAPGGGESPLTLVPHGAQFATKPTGGPAQSFEYLGPDLKIDLSSSQVEPLASGKLLYEGLPVRQSRTVPSEIVGSSTGEPNQRFPLSQGPLLLDSLEVEVNEGGGWTEWQRADNFLYHTEPDGQITVSTTDSRTYSVQVDENDTAFLVFGDGVYSRRPPAGTNNIRARYAVGGGTAGNVPAGAITERRTAIRLLDAVFNPSPAAGGAERESVDHAVRFGPLAFRSGQRAVTLSDFVALAHQAGGVAKVRARSRGWNQIDLYIAPEGDSCRPAPEEMKRRLVTYFENKRMVGTFVTIRDPIPVFVDISVEVVAQHHHNTEAVRQTVENAIRGLLAFANVEFGSQVYLSKIYEAAEALPGVYAATVTRFKRRDRAMDTFEQELEALIALGISDIPDRVRRALNLGISTQGVIEVSEIEIPVLGELEVRVKEMAR